MESRCLEYRVISNKNVGPFNIISRNNLVESSSLKPFKFKTIFFFHIRQTLISIEMGKPITLATMEVMLTANVFTYYAGWCDKITGKTIPAPGNLIFLQIYNFIRYFFFVFCFFAIAMSTDSSVGSTFALYSQGYMFDLRTSPAHRMSSSRRSRIGYIN